MNVESSKCKLIAIKVQITTELSNIRDFVILVKFSIRFNRLYPQKWPRDTKKVRRNIVNSKKLS